MSVFGKVGWKVMTVAVGIPIGIAVRKGIDATWRKARPADPPRHPSDPDVTWQDAVAWGALSGLGLAVAQVVTNKGAAKAWRGLTGSEPPPKVAAEKHRADEAAKAEKKEAAEAEKTASKAGKKAVKAEKRAAKAEKRAAEIEQAARQTA